MWVLRLDQLRTAAPDPLVDWVDPLVVDPLVPARDGRYGLKSMLQYTLQPLAITIYITIYKL